MKITLAIIALLSISAPAHAAQYWVDNGIATLRPPADCDHKPTVPVVEISRPFADVSKLCGNLNDVDGCSVDSGDQKQGIRFLVMYANATPGERKVLDKVLIDPSKPWVIALPQANGFKYTDALVDHVRRHEWCHVNKGAWHK